MELKKQLQPKPYTLEGVQYSISPLPAMDAVCVLGDLLGVIAPALSSLAPAFMASKNTKLDDMLGDVSVDSISTGLFKGLNGTQMKALFNELLIQYGNVMYHDPDDSNATNYLPMDIDAFNEIFCQDVGSAMTLCGFVIKQNFTGFFGKLKPLFGSLFGGTKPKKAELVSMGLGTKSSSAAI